MDILTIAEVAENAGPRLPLHELKSGDEIGYALDLMDKEKLLVAPVRNEQNEYCALVSVFDLVNYAVLEKLPKDNLGSLLPEDIPALKDTVMDVVNEGYKRFYLPVFKKDENIRAAMKEFSYGKHKVLVTEDDGSPMYLFSQHDLIKFMEDNPSSIPEELKPKTAEDLDYLKQDIVSASPSTPVVDILRLLAEHDMTAVPLINGKGEITGTFSQSDLKGLSTLMLVDLFLEAIQFLEDEEARGAGRPLTVQKDAKFGEIMLPLAYSGAHRAWILDDEHHMVGVASMTGVIRSVMTDMVA